MEISTDRELLREIENFLNEGKLIDFMNENYISFPAMAFIIETLHRALKDIKDTMEEEE